MKPDPHSLAYAVASLRAEGNGAAADALLKRFAGTDDPEPVEKAMSAYADATGGVLVPPSCAPRRKKKRNLRALGARALKGLEGE